jgi:hypothetical protein
MLHAHAARGATMTGSWVKAALIVAASGSAMVACGTSGGSGQGPGVCGASTDRTQAGMIHVTASTNSPELFVVVYCDGSAERTLGAADAGNVSGVVPKVYEPSSPDVLRFLADLDLVGDVSAIPASHVPVYLGGECGKSVSFGTVTTITAGGKTSGDMQCIQNPTADQTALAADCRVLAPWP